ncbi:hypothetical protein [Kribbella sp. CA-294648]|uniref:hypothetical protein n=1 Tax=Kribbella sp. CA-294648 TaxID=3239948 RepID=UPI003D8E3DED
MADQTGADAVRSVLPATEPSALGQAATDSSLTEARHRAVDPVPIVAVDVTDGAELATLETVDGVPSAPIWRVRRKLSPRPVPGNRRRKPPVPALATDEEPIPAEEMDDVGTQPDKAAKTAAAEQAVTSDVAAEETPAAEASSSSPGATTTATTTATRSAKPKTAAEIVAEQRAREKAAAEAPQDTAVTKPVTRQPASPSSPAVSSANASKPKPAVAKKTVTSSSSDKGKAALSAVGSGVKRFRNLVASLVWLVAVIAAAVLALGALFTALDQANQSNEIVKWVLERGHDLVGPFKDLFRLETAKNTLLVNWGIAALVYLVIGKIAERFIRP